MQRNDVATVLRTTLCRTLTPAQATELARSTVPVGVPAGGFVFRQGDKTEGLLIFVAGSVEVSRRANGGESHVIATVNAPTVLGEMGLVMDRPRSASIKAVTACEFHLLRKADFARMLESDQVAAFKLIGALAEILAKRLEAADDRLLAMAEEARAVQTTAAAPPAAPTAPAAPPPDARVAELDALRAKLFSEWSF